MRNLIYMTIVGLIYIPICLAQTINLNEMDSEARASGNMGRSLMFKQNAEQYRQLTDAEKKELEARRLEAKRIREEQEKIARQRAIEEAQRKQIEEEERKRAEALKPITLYEDKLKIYALINGEVISSNDMQSRINAFILTTGIPYNAQTKEMISAKVLQAAIDEKLKIQEAKKNNIHVSKKEIDDAVKSFENSNNIPSGELKNILNNAKVSMNIWTKQIESDIAWKKLISQKGYEKINIGESDISRAMKDITEDMKIQKYMVSEIVIEKKDAKDLNQLVDNLRHDPRFELYAMQFSQSPSSANGGRLGWIVKGQLPQILENAVLKMKEGEVSDPIAYGKDMYILKLEKIFNPQTDKAALPTRREIKVFLENKRLEEFSTKYIKDLRSRALIEKKV